MLYFSLFLILFFRFFLPPSFSPFFSLPPSQSYILLYLSLLLFLVISFIPLFLFLSNSLSPYPSFSHSISLSLSFFFHLSLSLITRLFSPFCFQQIAKKTYESIFLNVVYCTMCKIIINIILYYLYYVLCYSTYFQYIYTYVIYCNILVHIYL